MASAAASSVVRVSAEGVDLEGDLAVPPGATGVVLFAHGSGSSRHSRRNQYVAGELNDHGLATLLIDLLSADEGRVDERTAQFRFDIPLLARRLVETVHWLLAHDETTPLRVGLFGASTGAAAALIAAAQLPGAIRAVVSRGGRPDLAGDFLSLVRAPVLLLVGGRDPQVLQLNEEARTHLRSPSRLVVVPGAGHLFEEQGALDEVARSARSWFGEYLSSTSDSRGG